jgi:hypothetical protein
MKSIGPQWNRQNLDNINENFNTLNQNVTSVPGLIADTKDLKEQAIETTDKVIALENRFRFYVDINLNDCVVAGLYYIGSGNNQNMPPGKASGMLKVTSSRTNQIVHQEYTSASIAEQTFVRRLRDNNWSEWIETTVTKKQIDDLEKLINDAESILSDSVLINPTLTDSTNGWTRNAGNPIVVVEQGVPTLIAQGDGSHQLSQMVNWKKDHVYYMQVEVYVTDYVTGRMGLQANGRFVGGNVINLGVTRDTEGWESLYTNFVVTEDYTLGVYYGSISSANLNGKAKNAYIVDLTEMYGAGNEPSAVDFYNLKLPMENDGISMNTADVFKVLDHKIDNIATKSNITATDAQAEQVFFAEMNRKCQLWKMNDTVFKNASGLSSSGQVSSARDMLRLTLQAAGSERMLKVWGAKSYDVNIRGGNPRTVNIVATVSRIFIAGRKIRHIRFNRQ